MLYFSELSLLLIRRSGFQLYAIGNGSTGWHRRQSGGLLSVCAEHAIMRNRYRFYSGGPKVEVASRVKEKRSSCQVWLIISTHVPCHVPGTLCNDSHCTLRLVPTLAIRNREGSCVLRHPTRRPTTIPSRTCFTSLLQSAHSHIINPLNFTSAVTLEIKLLKVISCHWLHPTIYLQSSPNISNDTELRLTRTVKAPDFTLQTSQSNTHINHVGSSLQVQHQHELRRLLGSRRESSKET